MIKSKISSISSMFDSSLTISDSINKCLVTIVKSDKTNTKLNCIQKQVLNYENDLETSLSKSISNDNINEIPIKENTSVCIWDKDIPEHE